jgi:Tol biopolymer transport system component
MRVRRRPGAYHLYQRASAGGPEERLLESSAVLYATQWSPDGRFIVYEAFDPKTRGDLWVLPVTGDRKPMVFAATEFSEVQGQLSPDGRWMAYRSNESGREEIYVQPFPPTGGKWQVSNGGGQPRWRRDGRELYYVAPDSSLMAVSIAAGPTFQAGVPKALFESRVEATGIKYSYAIARDGQRFLLLIEEPKSPAITVVINWTALLKQ